MSDFYDIEALLPDDDRALLGAVRAFMREEVAPIINDYWSTTWWRHRDALTSRASGDRHRRCCIEAGAAAG